MSRIRFVSLVFLLITHFTCGIQASRSSAARSPQDDMVSIDSLPNLGKLSPDQEEFTDGYEQLCQHTENLIWQEDAASVPDSVIFHRALERLLQNSSFAAITFMKKLAPYLSNVKRVTYFQSVYDQAKESESTVEDQFSRARNTVMKQSVPKKGETLNAHFILVLWQQEPQGWLGSLLLTVFQDTFENSLLAASFIENHPETTAYFQSRQRRLKSSELYYAALSQFNSPDFERNKNGAYNNLKTLVSSHQALLDQNLAHPDLVSVAPLWEEIEYYNIAVNKLTLFAQTTQEESWLKKAATLWIPRTQFLVWQLYQSGWRHKNIAETLPRLRPLLSQISGILPTEQLPSRLGFDDFLKEYWQHRLKNSADQGTGDIRTQAKGLFDSPEEKRPLLLSRLGSFRAFINQQLSIILKSIDSLRQQTLEHVTQAAFNTEVENMKQICLSTPLILRAGQDIGSLNTDAGNPVTEAIKTSSQGLLTFHKEFTRFIETHPEIIKSVKPDQVFLLLDQTFNYLQNIIVPMAFFLGDSIIASYNLEQEEREPLQHLWFTSDENSPAFRTLVTLAQNNILQALTLHQLLLEKKLDQVIQDHKRR